MGEGVQLYIGGDAYTVQRRRCFLVGRRMFSGAYGPVSRFLPEHVPLVDGVLDSGAFSDPPEKRLDPEEALARQFKWEANATRLWGAPYQSSGIVSYDLLIDEKWASGKRKKERWGVEEADRAVRITVDAAAYLSKQRERLRPRRLILAVQGVDAIQYRECLDGVMEHATPSDWIGLGGWCILGRNRSYLPTFWAAMRACLPKIADAGIRHVHLFGVMWRPPLGGLLWLADQHGLTVSTDSKAPILNVTWKDLKRAGGILDPTWEGNCAAHTAELGSLRSSQWYKEPPEGKKCRQLLLF